MSGILFYVPIFFWSTSAKFVRLVYSYECWDLPDEGHLPPAITHQLPTLKPPTLKSSHLKTPLFSHPTTIAISFGNNHTFEDNNSAVQTACANVRCRQSPVVQERILMTTLCSWRPVLHGRTREKWVTKLSLSLFTSQPRE